MPRRAIAWASSTSPSSMRGSTRLHERGLLECHPRPPLGGPAVGEREVGEVALAQGRPCRAGVAGVGAVLGGDRADRLEQAVARRTLPALDVDQRLVDERPDHLGDVVDVAPRRARRRRSPSRCRSSRRTPPGAGTPPARSGRAGRSSSRAAPAACAGVRQRASSRRRSDGEATIEAGEDLRRREDVGAGGGELDGERQPIEPPADRERHGAVVAVEAQRAVAAVVPGRRRGRRSPRSTAAGATETVCSPRDAEPFRLVASSAVAGQSASTARASSRAEVEDVLAVVQQHQRALGRGDARRRRRRASRRRDRRRGCRRRRRRWARRRGSRPDRPSTPRRPTSVLHRARTPSPASSCRCRPAPAA